MKKSVKRAFEQILRAGLDAVDPERAVHKHMKRTGNELKVGGRVYGLDGFKRVVIAGAGKGTAPMARALEEILGDRLNSGHIIVKYGHGLALEKTRVAEAGHPVPDEAGVEGARKLVDLLSGCKKDDLVIFAFSGGGSALLPLPRPPVNFEQKRETTQLLLECGAEIDEINAIRKHLSLSKGGALAKIAHPATVISLFLSDVIGDHLDVIASGPTVPDSSTFDDCVGIINRYGIEKSIPPKVMQFLINGAAGLHSETPKPGDSIFKTVQNLIVGNNRSALMAAKDRALALGYTTLVLSSRIRGEAREVAQVFAAIGKEIADSGLPVQPPACILAGGETTVTIKGNGKGGRNQELVLAAAGALNGWEKVAIMSAGTDGTDGPTDAAGAFADGGTVKKALMAGMDFHDFLARNDAYHFFEPLGLLLKTGPTRTNVMDMICVMVE